jgi:hypothetical protein
MMHHSVIARHDSAEAIPLVSLRGARFLAYASEQAPQSRLGRGLPRTFQVLAMTKGNTWTRETPLGKFS